METRTGNPAFGAGLVLAAAVLWGTVGPAQVLASSPMAPTALGGWRLLAGGLVLAVLTVRPRTVRALASRTVLCSLLLCAFTTGLFQAVFLSSVARTGAALATVIALGTAPAAIGVCARRITGERMSPAWVISTVTAVCGCALLLGPGSARVDPVGLLLGVAAGTCYGLYTVFAKQMAADTSSVELPALSALSLLLGSLFLLPWMINGASPVHDSTTIALVTWLGLATTTAAYWLFTAGISRVRATTAGTLSLAEPLAAALIGVLFLHEHLSLPAWAGCALILAGMVATCLLPLSRGQSSAQVTEVPRHHRITFVDIPEPSPSSARSTPSPGQSHRSA
jgi:DME family drug/metabolite transporter